MTAVSEQMQIFSEILESVRAGRSEARTRDEKVIARLEGLESKVDQVERDLILIKAAPDVVTTVHDLEMWRARVGGPDGTIAATAATAKAAVAASAANAAWIQGWKGKAAVLGAILGLVAALVFGLASTVIKRAIDPPVPVGQPFVPP